MDRESLKALLDSMPEEERRIFIQFNVPSLKNSKVATGKGVFHSKTVRKYLQNLGVKGYRKKEHEDYKKRPNLFEEAVAPLREYLTGIEPPYILRLHFIRDTKRKFDFINACQIIFDLLVAHQVIEDDNMDWLIPMPLMINWKWYSVDKEHAGVIIEVEI